MEKKARAGIGALRIIGIVYAILGGSFVILGTALAIFLPDWEGGMTGGVFGTIGAIFLILGILFLILELRKKRRADKLLASGRYVWGEVVDCVPNFNVRINGGHPYVVVVRYVDSRGVTHIFKSPGLRIFRDPEMIGRKVKVYIEDDSYRHYYVDVDEILPNVVVH